MKFHDGLDDLLGNAVRVRILRILTRYPARGFTGRALARECSASPSQTNTALEQLMSTGIVFREVAGRSHVWRLAEGHVLAPHLKGLFAAEAGSMATLQKDLGELLKGLPVERAVLFGSVARGEERATSDIDLFVQVETRFEKDAVEDALSAASARFSLRFGNPLSSLVLENRRVRRPSRPALIDEILREGVAVKG